MPPYNITDYGNAIAAVESRGSGDYGAIGPLTKGDRAYGRYQVMGANIPEWTRAALGRQMTADEFLRDPAAQDAVFAHRFGGYVDRYGNPQDAATAWFAGPGAVGKQGVGPDVLGTTVPGYLAKFNAALGLPGGTAPAASAAAAGPVQGILAGLGATPAATEDETPAGLLAKLDALGAPAATAKKGLLEPMPFLPAIRYKQARRA